MNLYLFPEAACHFNGYGIAVEAAYRKLPIQDEDVVVWYTSFPREKMSHVRETDHIVPRPPFFSLRSVRNTLARTNRSEVRPSDLRFLYGKRFDRIYCDETCFYHAIRALYPKQNITVRFHNSFARIHDRLHLLKDREVDLLYKITLSNMYRLERDVMSDKQVHKIFLSNEDRNYYTSHYGRITDSEVFHFEIDLESARKHRKNAPVDHRLVWFGGVESHKKTSILWFIRDVLGKVRKELPDVEFHLWGRGTESFHNPATGVYGHGFYQGTGNPAPNSLYVNPDIIGGGVKIKLMSLIESGCPIISTPFGFEGYTDDLKDTRYCLVSEEDAWAQDIVNYLKQYS